ncbi:hypothetical protein J5N97_021940 [Dioscorea zingiberensis]|uniref:Cytochrome P450 n=1 Tax=Dioscorea zingiberensis TaxID=325984 RepID=A0A9D5HAI5_9LILI|nr:hypothetical protein J5N97_021940 [Dioscorea zingiberensis]
MELCLFIILTISLFITFFFFFFTKNKKKLPPGPLLVPILGSLLWLRRSPADIVSILRYLHSQYGHIFTVHIGSHPFIFIFDRSLAHKVLIEHGSVFSDRPLPPPAIRFLSMNQQTVTSSPYGPLWRLLRRNLISEILNPSRVKLFAHSREWVLHLLLSKLHLQSSSGRAVVTAMDSLRFAMFSLLVLMCFGEKLDEDAIKDIEFAQRELLLYAGKLNVFSIAPIITKRLFRHRFTTAFEMIRRQKELYTPLLTARKEHKKTHINPAVDDPHGGRFICSYLDSLLDIKLPDENCRALTDDELMVLCSEFINAGTDTTATALEWIMANVVKYPDVQAKMREEIERVAGDRSEGIKEEELQKMPYLKAVVMEGLRRHPPGHLVLPHSVSEEIVVDGYVIPKNATINFGVAAMGWDEKVWEKPMEFRPERFLDEGVDVTGSREIKMMPFGVGRRICPGLGLSLLHLEYFVANLVREFEWREAEGEEIDLAEKPEFTVVMKNSMRARIIPRHSAAARA